MLRKTLSTGITAPVSQPRVSRLQNRHKNPTSNSNNLEVITTATPKIIWAALLGIWLSEMEF